MIGKNISWLLADKIVRIFGGLLVGIWTARYLGPSDFGVLNYALAYIAMFTVFVNLGLDQILIRELVKKKRLTNYFLGTAFTLKLFGSIVAIVGVFLSLFYIDMDQETKIIIFILSLGFVLQSVDVIDYYYQSKVLSKYVVMARGCAFMLGSLLKVYLIISEYEVIYFIYAIIVESVLTLSFLVFIYQKISGHMLRWRFSKTIAVSLLKYSWPLAISLFLISIHMKVDQLMIGSMLSVEQVGIYSVAVKLSEFWLFIPAVLVSTLLPYFVQLRDLNSEDYHCRLLQLYSLMFWMGIIVGVLVILFGESIISLLYGGEYSDAYLALVFNIWSGIFISQAVARGIWMISENLQKYRLYNNILAVIFNIVANMILIPRFGIAGAAMATLGTQFIGTWIFSFLWRPLRSSTWGMIKSVNPVYLIQGLKKVLA